MRSTFHELDLSLYQFRWNNSKSSRLRKQRILPNPDVLAISRFPSPTFAKKIPNPDYAFWSPQRLRILLSLPIGRGGEIFSFENPSVSNLVLPLELCLKTPDHKTQARQSPLRPLSFSHFSQWIFGTLLGTPSELAENIYFVIDLGCRKHDMA